MYEFELSPTPIQDVPQLLRGWIYVGSGYALDTNRAAKVIGFGEKYVQHGGANHRYAGTYIDYTHLHLAIERTNERLWHRLTPADFGSDEVRATFLKVSRIMIRIGDLPPSDFWVGDKVILDSSHLKHERTIGHVDYEQNPVRYTVEWGKSPIASTTAIGEELTLVERGPAWNFAHGKLSLEQGAAFFHSIGMSDKVRVPHGVDAGSAYWTFEMAAEALRNGDAHEMKLKRDLRPIRFVVIRYDDPVFAEKMRLATLREFGLIDEEAAA